MQTAQFFTDRVVALRATPRLLDVSGTVLSMTIYAKSGKYALHASKETAPCCYQTGIAKHNVSVLYPLIPGLWLM